MECLPLKYIYFYIFDCLDKAECMENSYTELLEEPMRRSVHLLQYPQESTEEAIQKYYNEMVLQYY